MKKNLFLVLILMMTVLINLPIVFPSGSYEQTIIVNENQTDRIKFIVINQVNPPFRYINDFTYFPDSWEVSNIRAYDFENLTQLKTDINQSNNRTYLTIWYPYPVFNQTYKYIVEFERYNNNSYKEGFQYEYGWSWGNGSSEIPINLSIILPANIVIDNSSRVPNNIFRDTSGTKLFYAGKSPPNEYFYVNIVFHKFQEPKIDILINSITEEILKDKSFVVTGYIVHQEGSEVTNLTPRFKPSAHFAIDSEINLQNTTLRNKWIEFQFRLKPLVVSDSALIGKLYLSYYDELGHEHSTESNDVYLKIKEEPKTEFWIGSVIIPIITFLGGLGGGFLLFRIREKSKRKDKHFERLKRSVIEPWLNNLHKPNSDYEIDVWAHWLDEGLFNDLKNHYKDLIRLWEDIEVKQKAYKERYDSFKSGIIKYSEKSIGAKINQWFVKLVHYTILNKVSVIGTPKIERSTLVWGFYNCAEDNEASLKKCLSLIEKLSESEELIKEVRELKKMEDDIKTNLEKLENLLKKIINSEKLYGNCEYI